MLSKPFLGVTREYLYTEANRHRRLRPAGRSLFGRLSRGDVTRPELRIRVTSPHGASSPEPRRRAVMFAAMTCNRR
jgi:hypothetical protein